MAINFLPVNGGRQFHKIFQNTILIFGKYSVTHLGAKNSITLEQKKHYSGMEVFLRDLYK